MYKPNPRGCLTSNSPFIPYAFDKNAPTDYKPHFPAGDKTASPGAGKRSQEREAGERGWVPFRPHDKNFRWRYGVCGDQKGGVEDHRRGGEYFYNAKRVASYLQGSVIEVGISVVAHHNGFMEMHICNLDKCNGDFSEKCFRDGHCRPLERARNEECDSGNSMRCGPIDKNYPARWYLPCTKYYGNDFQIETFGSNTIQYKLPSDLHCDHCGILWHWAAATTCLPDGVREYFTGPNRPVEWARRKCRGQAGAIGGVDLNRGNCGGREFSEEYLQCADVTIRPRGGYQASAPVPKRQSPVTTFDKPVSVPVSEPEAPVTQPPVTAGGESGDAGPYDLQRGMDRGFGYIRDIVLIGDGKRIKSLNERPDVSVREYQSISVEAITESSMKTIEFRVNGQFANSAENAPFYVGGRAPDGKPLAWSVPRDQYVNIEVRSDGDIDSVRVIFRS